MSDRGSPGEAPRRGRRRAAPPSPPRPAATRHPPEEPFRSGGAGRGVVGWAAPALLVGLGLAAYHNSFAGAFVFDDEARIVDNTHIRHLWPPWDAMAQSSRPLVELSLAVNYALGGLDVWGYHAFNLAVHLLAGLVLFGIVRRMLESERLRVRYGRTAPWLAFAAAALWLVHPVQTESVTYLIQRAESLMGLFYLLTLYTSVRGFQSSHARPWFVAAVAACALGMGSKEVMVSAPIIVLLYDRLFVSESLRDIARRRWGLYAGLAATWLVLGALLAASRQAEQTVMVAGVTPWRYAATQFGVIVHYLRLSIWPRPLTLDYAWPLAGTVSAVAPWAAVVAAFLGGTVLCARRLPLVAFWGGWFFLVLAPTSSVFPIADLAFEHRMYLPLAAVAVLGVIGVHEAVGLALRRLGAPERLGRSMEVSLLGATLALLVTLTVSRNEHYRSDLAIWSDTALKRPENPRAHYNLGHALYRRRQVDEALAQFSEAVRLKPDFPEAQNNLGGVLYLRGRADDALAHYAEALRLKPDYADAHRNMGRALLDRGRIDEAIAHLERAVRLQPGFAEAANDLRRARVNLASALARQGRNREAIAQYSEAVRLMPDSASAQNDLGALLYRDGRLGEAIARYSEALRLKPNFPEAHQNLGLALAKQGDTSGAIAHFAEAVRLKPDFAQAHNNLGILLYREGHIVEAIAHFSEAARLDPAFADARTNLRAAEASLAQSKQRR